MADVASAEELAILDQGVDNDVDDKVEKIEDDKEPLKVDAETDEEEVEEKEEETEEKEEEDKTPKEELAPHERPSLAQVRAKFPEFFKEFPQFKDIIYREQEYTTLFPTISDAREAADNNEAFVEIQNDLFKGDGTKFLSALQETKQLDKFSRNVLTSLYKVSPEAQWNAVAPVLQNAIRAFYNDSEDENNRNAALRMSKFLFGTHEIAEGKRSAIKEVRDEPKEDNEEKEWKNERYNTFNIDTLQSTYEGLNTQIMDKIDPDGVLSTFMKDAIAEKCISEVRRQLEKDGDHMRYMKSLWTRAEKNGYTSADKSSITSAFLARAKALVPNIRRKLIAEALGTSAKINLKKQEVVDKGQLRKEPGSSGKAVSNGNKVYNPRQIDFSKTSELDIINGTVTLKK
jgi:hypothetical protein